MLGGNNHAHCGNLGMQLQEMQRKGLVKETRLTGYSCQHCSSKNPKIYVATEDYNGFFSRSSLYGMSLTTGIFFIIFMGFMPSIKGNGDIGAENIFGFMFFSIGISLLWKMRCGVRRGDRACIERDGCLSEDFDRLPDG